MPGVYSRRELGRGRERGIRLISPIHHKEARMITNVVHACIHIFIYETLAVVVVNKAYLH